MKKEFFFMTRLAGVLYDPYVEQHLKLPELRDAMSDGQILSKMWLIEELTTWIGLKDKKVVILGGWIGTLALLLNTFELGAKITNIDIDHRSNLIARKLNYDFDFEALTMDMYDVDYSDFDVIINTSSEHIPNIEQWIATIPKGKIVVVQNNNFLEGEGHISCVENENELCAKLNLSDSWFAGSKKFYAYDRFMVIGRT